MEAWVSHKIKIEQFFFYNNKQRIDDNELEIKRRMREKKLLKYEADELEEF